MIESFWSRMQVELLDTWRSETRVELANAVFEYLEIWHNPPTPPLSARHDDTRRVRSSLSNHHRGMTSLTTRLHKTRGTPVVVAVHAAVASWVRPMMASNSSGVICQGPAGVGVVVGAFYQGDDGQREVAAGGQARRSDEDCPLAHGGDCTISVGDHGAVVWLEVPGV